MPDRPADLAQQAFAGVERVPMCRVTTSSSWHDPVRCAYAEGHPGAHSWASIPAIDPRVELDALASVVETQREALRDALDEEKTRGTWEADPEVRARLELLTDEWLDANPEAEIDEVVYSLFESRERCRRARAALAVSVGETPEQEGVGQSPPCKSVKTWGPERMRHDPERS